MTKLEGESYTHSRAREVMIEWLRSAAERAGHDRDATFGPLNWRVNRKEPGWGIFEEYPIIDCMCNGCVYAWDEFPNWDITVPNITRQNVIPTRAELMRAGIVPKRIVDIAIQEKGRIFHVIEIVHTNGLTRKKLAFLSDRAQVSVWRADAQRVLDHTSEPQEFADKRFFRSVASNKQIVKEVLEGWRVAGRPDEGILWDGVAAEMVRTLSPEAKKTFDTLPSALQKNIIRIRADGYFGGTRAQVRSAIERVYSTKVES